MISGVANINSFSFFCVSLLQHYFLIVFGHDGQKPLELRTEEESECDEWVEAIQQARYTQHIDISYMFRTEQPTLHYT